MYQCIVFQVRIVNIIYGNHNKITDGIQLALRITKYNTLYTSI